MDKEWVDKKNAALKEEFNKEVERIKTEIKNCSFLNNAQKEGFLVKFEENLKKTWYSGDLMLMELKLIIYDLDDDISDKIKWAKSLNLENVFFYRNLDYSRYLDSEIKEFDGDIIITDPCYITRAKHHGTEPLYEDDWGYCNYGKNMETLGIKNYITRDTIYGDWSCTTYNTDTKEVIGRFCADAGLVSVFLLDEVLAYNPGFDYHLNQTWTTTWIKNFKGTVQCIVEEIRGVHEEDTKWWKKGDLWTEYEVKVVGHGINKVTGEPINFIGTQTGF